MKQALSISIIAVSIFILSCNSTPSDAQHQAKEVQTAIKQARPGSVATTADGYTMTAKINGKQWTADAMMPPAMAGRIIGYYNGEYIGLPFDKQDAVAGKKIIFGSDNATDLATNDDIGMWGGRKGEMEYTKVGDKYAEGTFYFTGNTSKSDKTIEVTSGFFRIPVTE